MLKKSCLSILMMVTCCVSLVFAQNRTITVIGTVVSDQNNTPIEGAMVILGSGLTNQNTDTAYTGADGTFIKQIEIDQTGLALVYSVSKDGYRPVSGFARIANNSDTLDLETIVLSEGGGQTDTIEVTGTVLDSVTQEPVENALVLITLITNLVDTANLDYDSVYTDANGELSLEMVVTRGGGIGQIRILVYRVIKDGYEEERGFGTIRGQAADLGDILLVPSSVAILPDHLPSFSTQKSNRIMVYSLQGRLLYTGKEINPLKLFSRGTISLQPVMIHYYSDKKLLYTQKIIFH